MPLINHINKEAAIWYLSEQHQTEPEDESKHNIGAVRHQEKTGWVS